MSIIIQYCQYVSVLFIIDDYAAIPTCLLVFCVTIQYYWCDCVYWKWYYLKFCCLEISDVVFYSILLVFYGWLMLHWRVVWLITIVDLTLLLLLFYILPVMHCIVDTVFCSVRLGFLPTVQLLKYDTVFTIYFYYSLLTRYYIDDDERYDDATEWRRGTDDYCVTDGSIVACWWSDDIGDGGVWRTLYWFSILMIFIIEIVGLLTCVTIITCWLFIGIVMILMLLEYCCYWFWWWCCDAVFLLPLLWLLYSYVDDDTVMMQYCDIVVLMMMTLCDCCDACYYSDTDAGRVPFGRILQWTMETLTGVDFIVLVVCMLEFLTGRYYIVVEYGDGW